MSRFFKGAFPVLSLLSPAIPLAFYFRYNWYSFFHLYSLSVTGGVFGYIYFLNQFITGGRLRFLDRLYGYDRVLLFHRYTAIAGFLLLIFHAIGKDVELAEAQVVLGIVAMTLFSIFIVLALLFLSGALARFSAFARLREWVRRRLGLQYQHFLLIHNLTAVAMLVGLVHVLLASSTRESPGRFGIMTLWYVGAMGTYLWYKFARPRGQARRPFRVARIVRNAPQVVSIELERGGNNDEKAAKVARAAPKPAARARPRPAARAAVARPAPALRYRPGQFCFVRFLTGEMARDEHPFTISSAPGAGDTEATAVTASSDNGKGSGSGNGKGDANDNASASGKGNANENGKAAQAASISEAQAVKAHAMEAQVADAQSARGQRLTLTIKDCGDWSAALATQARVGDEVAVDGAYGKFGYTSLPPKQTKAPLVFIAGGVGITPFLSMLDQLAAERSRRPVYLIWKTRTQQELFLDTAVATWKEALPNLRTEFFCSALPRSGGSVSGVPVSPRSSSPASDVPASGRSASLRSGVFASGGSVSGASASGGSASMPEASPSAAHRISVQDMCVVLGAYEITRAHFFMCGPESLIRDIRVHLRRLGVQRSRIHYENFSF